MCHHVKNGCFALAVEPRSAKIKAKGKNATAFDRQRTQRGGQEDFVGLADKLISHSGLGADRRIQRCQIAANRAAKS